MQIGKFTMTSWDRPDNERILQDESVKLYPTELRRDAEALFQAASLAANGLDLFIYSFGAGPFEDYNVFKDHLENKLKINASLTYTVFSQRLNEVVGNISLLNIRAAHGTVEIGSVWLALKAQKSEINTHSIYLILCYLFDELKYRRVEWKCNNENEQSKRTALRLGFTYEGLFRQHFWDKGRNRDTAWYSIIDSEWGDIKEKLQSILRGYN